jgi:hypothetical protein
MKIIELPNLQFYEFQCDTDLIDRALQDLKSQNMEWGRDFDDIQNRWGSIGYLNLENKIPWYYEELFNWMQECIDEVAKLTIKVPLVICDSWATKSVFQEYTRSHIHSYSMLSGLLYFTDHKDSNTVFEYQDRNQQRFGLLFDTNNMHQGDLKFAPQKGKFIIFPSDIYHSARPHSELKNTRYTLGINTFFNGRVCNETTSMLELNVVTVKDRYLSWKSQQNDKDLK